MAKQNEQLDTLKTRYDKLTTVGERYGVSIEKDKDDRLNSKKLQENLESLQKQKRILSQAMETQAHKQKAIA